MAEERPFTAQRPGFPPCLHRRAQGGGGGGAGDAPDGRNATKEPTVGGGKIQGIRRRTASEAVPIPLTDPQGAPGKTEVPRALQLLGTLKTDHLGRLFETQTEDDFPRGMHTELKMANRSKETGLDKSEAMDQNREI